MISILITSHPVRPERRAHRAVTDVLEVRGSDGRLHVGVVQDTERQHDVKRQTAASTRSERNRKEV